jgi:DNA/RNA-binding protein KIN17
MKKERLTKSDEQRERQMINEQIEKATAEEEEQGGSSGSDVADNTPPAELLQRPEGEPVKISLSLNKAAASEPSNATPVAPSTSGISIKLGSSSSTSATKPALTNPLKPVTNPLRMNPLKAAAAPKPGNVFKSAAASIPAPVAGTKREREPLSVAESLMMEEMARKRRRMDQVGLRA